MIQEFYCTNTREYTSIPSCRGKLVFDSSRLQEGTFVYTLVKLHNKANLKYNHSLFMTSLFSHPYIVCSLYSNHYKIRPLFTNHYIQS